MDSDDDNEGPPPGWTKSKGEWEWEQARRKRLERVAQKIKKPGAAKREKAQRASDEAAGGPAEMPDARAAGADSEQAQSASKQPAGRGSAVDAEQELIPADPATRLLAHAGGQVSWQALCDEKDARIAREAIVSAQLRNDLVSLREELEQVRDEKHRLEARFGTECKEMKREIDKLKMELGIANATEQDLDQTVQELELKLTAAKTEAAETKRRLFVLTGVEQEKGALAQEVERLQQQISAVRAERAADHSEAFERNDEMADLQSQLDVARATVKALTREAAASKVDRDEIVRANTERDALSARIKEMEASQAALANLSTEKDQKRSDVGLMNSRIADLEEEMSIVLKKLEKSIVGLASKVKRGASDTLRLNMNLKMQASHLESYKRQLADAEKRLGKGSKQSKREIESLQVQLNTAIDVQKVAEGWARDLSNEILNMQKDCSSFLQEQENICATLDAQAHSTEQNSKLQRELDAERDRAAVLEENLRRKLGSTEQELEQLQNEMAARKDDADRNTVHGAELVEELNQRLAQARRESVAWEKCADQRQLLCQQKALAIDELREQVSAHVATIRKELPGVVEMVAQIMEHEEDVDEVKSAAVFVEIVRVREQNGELKEHNRKLEAKVADLQSLKVMVERLEGQLSQAIAMHWADRNNMVSLIRTITPFTAEVELLLKTDVAEVSEVQALRCQVAQERAAAAACAGGVKKLALELETINTGMKKDFSKIGVHLRSQHQNSLLMNADLEDKAADINRLDDLLSQMEHEKMAAFAMHDEIQVLLERERQDKADIIRANTQQLALAQSSSEKQAWIFQSRLEKEEMAVQLAEKEDEIAVLQRKVREATNLERQATKKQEELSELVERFQPRTRQQQGALDDSLAREMSLRVELETAHEQLQVKEASINTLEVQLARALKALKQEELQEQKRASDLGAGEDARVRLDCMATEREALLTRKKALESVLHDKDLEVERIRAGFADEQAGFEAERRGLAKEILTLKERQREVEKSSATLLQDMCRSRGRAFAYIGILEGASARKSARHLRRCAFVAMSSHARQRTRMWNMASAYITNRTFRDADRRATMCFGFWKRVACKRYAHPLLPGVGAEADGIIVQLLKVQPEKLSMDEACKTTLQMQRLIKNLQHALENSTCRLSQTDGELAAAAKHIRSLQKDLAAVNKVGLAVQRHLGNPVQPHPSSAANGSYAGLGWDDADARERKYVSTQDARYPDKTERCARLSLDGRSRPSQLANEGPRQALYSVDGTRLPFSRAGRGVDDVGGVTFTPSKAHVSLESRRRSYGSTKDSLIVGGALYGGL